MTGVSCWLQYIASHTNEISRVFVEYSRTPPIWQACMAIVMHTGTVTVHSENPM
jgi:hypothetical protein